MTVTLWKIRSLIYFRGQGVVENFPGNYSDFRATKTVLMLSKKRKTKQRRKIEAIHWKFNFQ
jgi:hypothetical protein